MSARRAFLGSLIDDAGLFPPAALSMQAALGAGERGRQSAEAWMLGRFIVPVGRIEELIVACGDDPPPRLSVIVDGSRVAHDLARLQALERDAGGALAIDAIELRLPGVPDGDVRGAVLRVVAEIDAAGLPRDLGAYLEFSFTEDYRAHVTTTLDAIADARARSRNRICAKVRCGGLTADAVPTLDQLAFAIGILRAHEIPFKATAGLHHPLRARNEAAGFVMHGFLNVVGVAVLDFVLDLDERTRHRVLADHHASAFHLDDGSFSWAGLHADAEQVEAARHAFVHSFGSCSFTEPVDDLIALGILERVPS